MIFPFLLLKAPVSCNKRIENSPASVKSMIQFITLAKRSFPGQLDPSPASATAKSSCLAAVAEFIFIFTFTFIAKEELYHRQDHRCSFKSDPRSVVRPGEGNRPRPATKLLLSAKIKA